MLLPPAKNKPERNMNLAPMTGICVWDNKGNMKGQAGFNQYCEIHILRQRLSFLPL